MLCSGILFFFFPPFTSPLLEMSLYLFSLGYICHQKEKLPGGIARLLNTLFHKEGKLIVAKCRSLHKLSCRLWFVFVMVRLDFSYKRRPWSILFHERKTCLIS